MARPNKGVAHVDAMKGNRQAKHRVAVILQALCDQKSVADACAELGIGPTQFANLRTRMLQGAVDAMEPQPIGRPRLDPQPADEDLDELEQEIFDLEQENTMLQAKLEVQAALRAARASKSQSSSKPPPQRPRGPRRRVP